MRSLVLTIAAVALAAGLSGCSKSSTQQQTPSAESTSADQSTAATTPSPEQMKAIEATLPAPYNTADLANGQSKFALCTSCHTVAKGGPNMTGPNLYGIIGSKAATVPDFHFSDVMKASGITWDPQKLDQWITDPKVMLPGTKMTFAGLNDPKDRTDVIAYVMVMSGYKAK
jgi:cytochrome c